MLWSTCGGLGYLPAPGTVTSCAALALRLLCIPSGYFLYEVPFVFFLYGVSFYVSYETVKRGAQKDPSYIVIDEWMAMWAVSLFAPQLMTYQVVGLIVFRFFDISKYGFLSAIEALDTPHAVMLDDMLAAVWAIAACWVFFFLGLI